MACVSLASISTTRDQGSAKCWWGRVERSSAHIRLRLQNLEHGSGCVMVHSYQYLSTYTVKRQWREYDALTEEQKAIYDHAVAVGADHSDAMFASQVLL